MPEAHEPEPEPIGPLEYWLLIRSTDIDIVPVRLLSKSKKGRSRIYKCLDKAGGTTELTKREVYSTYREAVLFAATFVSPHFLNWKETAAEILERIKQQARWLPSIIELMEKLEPKCST